MQGGSASARLPVRVTERGPMKALGVRLHELGVARRFQECLALADEYEAIARVFGDEGTVGFVIQERMYAHLDQGHFDGALIVGQMLLARHRAAGYVLGEAKVLADLANAAIQLGLIGDGLGYLARAGLLLENTTRRNERYVSALGSYVQAAVVADLYEVAASGYQQLLAHLSPSVSRAEFCNIYWGELQVQLLMTWGLRLGQLGYGPEAVSRLRRAAAIIEDWLTEITGTDQEREVVALQALVLAGLGRIDKAIALAEPVVVALHATERIWGAWSAHLTLGVGFRTRGELTAARRELLAAARLAETSLPFDVRPIVRHELAVLNAQEVGTGACTDMLEAIRVRTQQLWQQRLQRVAMLRQAREHEQREMERAATEASLLFDPITGLGNRRRFDQLMATVDGGQLNSMIMVNVDKFQAINDTHSHSAGDYVLRELATILKANCRPADPLPIRYAGDEFIVFVHGDLPTAVAIAKRMRAAVATADFDLVTPGTPITISAGVATLRPDMTASELFLAAATNLYRAKRDGRDRVVG
jgi:diguanylate cyclase (GGDEF)-like protein